MSEKYVVKCGFDLNGAKAVDRVTNRGFRIFLYCAMAVSVALSAAMLLALKDADVVFWGVFCATMVGMSRLYLLVNPHLIFKKYGQRTGEVTYKFGKNAMTVASGAENTVVHYTSVLRLAETKDYFLIYPQKRAAYVLAKAGFVSGDPAAFLPFIEEKTGLKAGHYRV